MLSYHRIIVICVFLTKLVCNNSQLINLECDWSVEHQQCPVYGTTDWDCLQSKLKRKLNCTNEEKYHCVRNERGKWVEVCDKGEVCAKGQEPVYSKDSRIECRNCSDPERYEPVERKPSYRFSECSRKKTACPKDSLECPDEKAKHIQNRKCRCMYEKDFIPQGYDFAKDVWKCADSNNLICVKEVCPESVDGRFQSRGADYGCSLAVKPVTLAPTDTPVIRSSTEAPPIDTSTAKNPIGTMKARKLKLGINMDKVKEGVVALGVMSLDGNNSFRITLTVVFSCLLPIVLLVFGVLIKKRMQKSEPPGVPEGCLLVTSVGYTAVTLEWHMPKYNGGCKLKGFVLKMKEIGKNHWKKISIEAEEEAGMKAITYTVEQLSDGTSYLFHVAAENKTGIGAFLKMESSITTWKYQVPKIPRHVAAEFDMEKNCIHLSWSEPEYDGGKPVEDYCVEYSKIDGEEWLKSEPIAETGWMVENLEGGVKYRFRVRARNAVGSSSYGKVENPVTFCSVPDKPNMIDITKIESNQVTLTWEAPINDGGLEIKWYNAHKKQEGYDWEDLERVKGGQTTLKVMHLTPETTYWFGVCAENIMGLGKFLDYEKEVKLPKPPGCPDVPGEPTPVKIGFNEVLLSWGQPEYDGGSPVINYIVKEKVKIGIVTFQIEWGKMGPASTQCRISKLKAGTKYCFCVYAKNKYGTSEAKEVEFTTKSWKDARRKTGYEKAGTGDKVSAEHDSGMVDADAARGSGSMKQSLGPPSKPVGPLMSTFVNDSERILTWNPPELDNESPVTNYILGIQCEGMDWEILEQIPAGQEKPLRYRVKNLNKNTKYGFGVKAENQWGQSDYLEMVEHFQTKAVTENGEESHREGTESAVNINRGDILQPVGQDEESSKDLLMRKAEEYLGTLESAQDWERFYDNAGGIESQLKVYNIIPIENPLKLKTPVVTHTRGVPRGFCTYESSSTTNSLFSSASLLLFGNENYTCWMRLAAVHGGIANYNFYKHQLFSDKSAESILKAIDACQSEESKEEFHQNKNGNIDDLRESLLQMVIRETATLKSKCNTMQVHFLSSVTGYSIVQYFEKGTVNCFGDVSKGPEEVKPVSKNADKPNNDCLYIYWIHDPKLDPNSKRRHKIINRALPLIKIKE